MIRANVLVSFILLKFVQAAMKNLWQISSMVRFAEARRISLVNAYFEYRDMSDRIEPNVDFQTLAFRKYLSMFRTLPSHHHTRNKQHTPTLGIRSMEVM